MAFLIKHVWQTEYHIKQIKQSVPHDHTHVQLQVVYRSKPKGIIRTFFIMTQKRLINKNKLGYIKIKNFSPSKDIT